jgi:hypothetical protein
MAEAKKKKPPFDLPTFLSTLWAGKDDEPGRARRGETR